MSDRIVIVGGGVAAARVSRSYREAGGDGRVTMLSAEASLPYNRPPLSKGLLRGTIEPDAVLVDPAAAYAELEIDIRLEAPVVAVDPSAGNGRARRRRGARLRPARARNRVDPTAARDSRRGRSRASSPTGPSTTRSASARRPRTAGRVLIVGAGFIGMETAASLRSLGLEVTVIEPGERLFAALGHPELSTSLEQLYRDRGVELVLGDVVTELHGDGSLSHATTREGRRIEAGLAIVGVGVEPGDAVPRRRRHRARPWRRRGRRAPPDGRPRASSRLATSRASTIRWPDAGDLIQHWTNAHYQGECARTHARGRGRPVRPGRVLLHRGLRRQARPARRHRRPGTTASSRAGTSTKG